VQTLQNTALALKQTQVVEKILIKGGMRRSKALLGNRLQFSDAGGGRARGGTYVSVVGDTVH
jgi:hypothetical protein